MNGYIPLPSGSCEICGRPFEYEANPNWESVKQFFRLNPSNGYWLAKEHPICLQARENRGREERERKSRQDQHAQIKRAMSELGFSSVVPNKSSERFHVEPGNQRAHQALQSWTYSQTGVLLYGQPGRGKSHLMASFANKWTEIGMTVAFQNVSLLLALLRRGYDDDLFDERLRFVSSQAQILVLDDLGAEKPTEWGVEKLYMIIDTRLCAKLPLFVTTNCNEKELEERITARTTSRLKEMCSWVEVEGRDWREQIKRSRESMRQGMSGMGGMPGQGGGPGRMGY